MNLILQFFYFLLLFENHGYLADQTYSKEISSKRLHEFSNAALHVKHQSGLMSDIFYTLYHGRSKLHACIIS